MRGLDFSYGKPSGRAIRAAGYGAVFTYAGALVDAFNIKRAYASDWQASGLRIAVVVERQESFALGGAAAGKVAVQDGLRQMHDAGINEKMIGIAVDFDATLGGRTHSGSPGEANMRQIADTFGGAAEVTGWDRLFAYGGSYTCEWLAKNTPLTRFWQTAAWSTGLDHFQGSSVYQAGTVTVDGVQCDTNIVYDDRIFCYVPPAQPPGPVPATVDVRLLQRSVGLVGSQIDGIWGLGTDSYAEIVRHRAPVSLLQSHLGLVPDGVYGPMTAAEWRNAVTGVQHALGVPADGDWGPKTDAAYITASPIR